MTRRWTRRQGLPHDERGQALMETAVTLPIILVVSIGIFEFGRAYQTWQVLTNAAREGARVAVLPGVNDAAVTARVQEYLTDGLIANPASADIDVTRDNEINIGAGTASASRVTVNYPYQFMVLEPVAQLINPSTTVGAPLTMSATSLMRNE